jgi:hypothetical protein
MRWMPVIIVGVLTTLVGSYIVYKLGWNGDGGSPVSTQNNPQSPKTTSPTQPYATRPSGGWLPGRINNQVSFN